MGCMTKFCVIISSLVLISTMAGKACLASEGSKYQRPLSPWTVAVVNQLSSDQTVFVKCKSKNDDLDDHALKVGQNYQWQFKENMFSPTTTLYWCTLKTPKNLHATLDVFWREKHDWLSYRCNFRSCIWYAKDDGVYLLNIPQGSLELVHKWEA